MYLHHAGEKQSHKRLDLSVVVFPNVICCFQTGFHSKYDRPVVIKKKITFSVQGHSLQAFQGGQCDILPLSENTSKVGY